MAKFEKLAEAFEKNDSLTAKASLDDIGALHRSLAVINAVDKLQNQGVQVTRKAKMDYLLALRFVERASKTSGRDLLEEYRQRGSAALRPDSQPTNSTGSAKLNPADNPAEFEKAFKDAMKVIKEVEALQTQGKPVPDKLMQTYTICKKFLQKYT